MYSGNKYLVYLTSEYQRYSIVKYQVGSPIQRSMDQSLFSAPHGLSQSITSFIASYCQGIHQTPFSRLIRSRKRKTNSHFLVESQRLTILSLVLEKEIVRIVECSNVDKRQTRRLNYNRRTLSVSVLLDLERL